MPSQKLPKGPEQQGDLDVVERTVTKEPRRYQVVFHNDDYTPMEFVVGVLVKFFHKSESQATHLMLQVHHKGSAIADVCSRDIAETKVAQVMDHAHEKGHPLRVTAEPEGYGDSDN